MYPVKKEATTHTWKSWFSCKIISLHYGPTLHKQFPYTMLAQIDPDKIADFFPVQSCLWAVCQHCKGNVLVQCWLREIETTLYSLFSCKNMSVHPLGQNFTSIFFVRHVVLDVFKQHWLDNIPMQCCPSVVNTTLQRLFSS